MSADARWLAAAAAIAARARPASAPNPGVGAIIVKDRRVVSRGWTQAGGRPHAEAVALAAAGEQAGGATLYVTLEPCAHTSPRGPACADLVAASGLAQVVIGCMDPDPRTAGAGLKKISDAGTPAKFVESPPCRRSLSDYLTVKRQGRPEVVLKLALSLDGCIALASGESQWITGPEARAHTHAMRARADAIVVGGTTLRTDAPRLDARLPGLEHRSPQRWVLTRGSAPDGWRALPSPQAVSGMDGVLRVFVEGGAGAASAFLASGIVDRLLIYRAPILLGGRQGLGDFGLHDLAGAHGRWRLTERRQLGNDTLEAYDARDFL
ncbi:bifunctional diaminohydroxyphosphoribosylaminopyrimidine deaminase/5-amino-6-(5-phosphoribosylamino)uracil reductase RibD [Novosphingobium sp. Leaf2]|uniref:bifunctional diaminohydroxyphosphoribosylaminopyrimidine deaminase/5-amino-6-(5-phosphoribosylamino)uracil reductase RibD n=1 Tax=Novosphingobium sp. Leaf2 TaxID=1735670 RepID=UPI0007023941|nr:bifunctional diaminohydroxyphosphoribosylaminopyrimidine deaminase/5-amino-6-(5-phosphoribosylamino)uracil reductase RibD [Novosphingobium sp. Leaf2]KQM18701.1 riboflavin biosynthesis protein RibD [Novosphingobium sp. Leaf2]